MTDLEALRERVRTATGELDWHDALRLALLGRGDIVSMDGPHRGDAGEDEYSAWVVEKGDRRRVHVSDYDFPDRSLDAALALVERLAPWAALEMWWHSIVSDGDTVMLIDKRQSTDRGVFSARGASLPLAVCLALLSALIAQKVEGSTDA